jgi:hypothetical protein
LYSPLIWLSYIDIIISATKYEHLQKIKTFTQKKLKDIFNIAKLEGYINWLEDNVVTN